MPTRRLAAIMFTDIAGYTAMMQANETLGRQKAKRYRQVLEEQVEAHKGEVLQHYGDGSLSIFDSAVEAARCAREVQIQLQVEPTVPVRVGIHIGDIVRDGEDIYGDGINLASRVESMGVPGSILMTERVIHDVRSHPELVTQSMGMFAFKNSAEPIEVFALTNEGLAIPRPEDLGGKAIRVLEKDLRSKKFIKGLVYGFLGVAVAVLVWVGYSMTGRNAHTQSVQYVDAEGNTVTREAPTLAGTHRIVIFPLEDQLNDPAREWFRLVIPMLLDIELAQDMRLYCLAPLSLKEEYLDYNQPFLESLSFANELKIAQDLYADEFIDGKLSWQNDSLRVELNMHQVETGQELIKIDVRASNVYELADRLHVAVAAYLFPGETKSRMKVLDLPASGLISPKIDVLEKYHRAYEIYRTDYSQAPQAIDILNEAIGSDPNCAECYSLLTTMYFGRSESNKLNDAIDRALELSGSLPERRQFFIKYYYYQINNQPDKSRALLESWKELYPKDYNPYRSLIRSYQDAHELDKAKEIGLEALENGHKGQTLLTLANLYSATGDYQEAEKYYEDYAELYPSKTQKLVDLGNLYIDQGELQQARDYFDKLLVLNPTFTSVQVKLANTECRMGNFATALGMLNSSLQKAHTARDSVLIYRELEAYYRRMGQLNKAMKTAELKWAGMKRYSPEIIVSQYRFFQEIHYLTDLGMSEEYDLRLAKVKQMIPTSAGVLECVGNYLYALHGKDAEAFTKWSSSCEPILLQFIGENFQYASKAALHNLRGEYDQAMEAFETYAEETGSGKSSLEYTMSEIYRKAGHPEKAKEFMELKQQSDPNQPYWIVEQAKNHHALGDLDLAKELYSKAMDMLSEADPESKLFQETKAFGQSLLQ